MICFLKEVAGDIRTAFLRSRSKGRTIVGSVWPIAIRILFVPYVLLWALLSKSAELMEHSVDWLDDNLPKAGR